MDTSSAVINSQVNSKQYHYSSDSSDLIEPWTVARDGMVPIPAAECCGAIVKIIMGLRSVSTSKDVIVERKTPCGIRKQPTLQLEARMMCAPRVQVFAHAHFRMVLHQVPIAHIHMPAILTSYKAFTLL